MANRITNFKRNKQYVKKNIRSKVSPYNFGAINPDPITVYDIDEEDPLCPPPPPPPPPLTSTNYDRHRKPSDFSIRGLPSFNKKSPAAIDCTIITENDEENPLPRQQEDRTSPMEVVPSINDILNKKLTTNSLVNTIPNLGRSSLPPAPPPNNRWIKTRKTRQSIQSNQYTSPQIDPLLQSPDHSYLKSSHSNPYAKKAYGEKAMKLSIVKATNTTTNGRRQSICRSSSDEDFDPESEKKYRGKRTRTSQLKQKVSKDPSLSFYKSNKSTVSSESNILSNMTAPKLKKTSSKKCKTLSKAGSCVENPLCLDDEECMEEEVLSNKDILNDIHESSTCTSIQESPITVQKSPSITCNTILESPVSVVQESPINTVLESPISTEHESPISLHDSPIHVQDSTITTVQESPNNSSVLQGTSRYHLRSAPSKRSIPHLSTSNEWNDIDLFPFVSEVWIGSITTTPIQVEVSSRGIFFALEHVRCTNSSIRIDIRYNEIDRVEFSMTSSPMAILFHLKTVPFKREVLKVGSAFKMNDFWSIDDPSFLVRLKSKPDGISIDNMKTHLSCAKLEIKNIKTSEIQQIIQKREKKSKGGTEFDFQTTYDDSQNSELIFETRPRTRSSLTSTKTSSTKTSKTNRESLPSPVAIVMVPSFPSDKVILTYKPKQINTVLSITGFDLQCLKDGEYLNDKIINFYLLYLWDCLEDKGSHVHVFNSFFFSRLTNSKKDVDTDLKTPERSHVRVKSWTKNINIFDKKFTLVPVCHRSHWFLAIIICPEAYMNEEITEEIELLKPCILVLDSMLVRRRMVGSELKKYLTQEYSHKYQLEKDFSKLPISHPAAPGQTNTYDCGVYLLTYSESLFERIKTGDQLPEGDQWAPEHKVQCKRQAILDLILSLSDTDTTTTVPDTVITTESTTTSNTNTTSTNTNTTSTTNTADTECVINTENAMLIDVHDETEQHAEKDLTSSTVHTEYVASTQCIVGNTINSDNNILLPTDAINSTTDTNITGVNCSGSTNRISDDNRTDIFPVLLCETVNTVTDGVNITDIDDKADITTSNDNTTVNSDTSVIRLPDDNKDNITHTLVDS